MKLGFKSDLSGYNVLDYLGNTAICGSEETCKLATVEFAKTIIEQYGYTSILIMTEHNVPEFEEFASKHEQVLTIKAAYNEVLWKLSPYISKVYKRSENLKSAWGVVNVESPIVIFIDGSLIDFSEDTHLLNLYRKLGKEALATDIYFHVINANEEVRRTSGSKIIAEKIHDSLHMEVKSMNEKGFYHIIKFS